MRAAVGAATGQEEKGAVPDLLLWIAVIVAAVKIAATIWLVRQPDATTVTATPPGHAIYLASKVTPALFVATVLIRAVIQGEAAGFILFCVVALVVAIVLPIIVMRQRAAGKWYGLLHDIRQRRRR